MTVRKRLRKSNLHMFLIPMLTAAMLLLLGGGIAIYILETNYLPKIGLNLREMHLMLEQYEGPLQSFETFVWIYVGAVGMALILTILFTNVYLTRELFSHISKPLDILVEGVERIRSGDLDHPICYSEPDEFKAVCDAVDMMAAKLKASLEAEQRRQQSSKELIAGMSHDLKSPLTSIRAYTEALLEGVADTPEAQKKYLGTIYTKESEMEHMVARLLEFSKLELSEYPTKSESFELRDDLERIVFDMCGCAEQGHDIVTCYRNSKNYGDNWISAGIGLWFLRESRYLNGARAAVGSSCAVSGTGFLFTRRILERCGGWRFFLLTEDIEFTIDNVTGGVKIGYCPDAVTYDEQPVTFKQSWRQRMRWSRGYMQVFARYGGKLLRGMLHGSFSCYDMAMSIMPAAILTGLSIVVNIGAAIANLVGGGDWAALGTAVWQTFVGLYFTLFAVGTITTLTEWKNIRCSAAKKVLYSFTFPLFMLTFVPICIAAIFKNPGWQPIVHTRTLEGELPQDMKKAQKISA